MILVMVDPRFNLSLFLEFLKGHLDDLVRFGMTFLIGGFICHVPSSKWDDDPNRRTYCSGRLTHVETSSIFIYQSQTLSWSRLRAPLLPVTFPIFVASNSHFKIQTHILNFWLITMKLHGVAGQAPYFSSRKRHILFSSDILIFVDFVCLSWSQKISTSYGVWKKSPLSGRGPHHRAEIAIRVRRKSHPIGSR